MNTLTPIRAYQQDLAEHNIYPDSHQAAIVDELEQLYQQFIQQKISTQSRSWWHKIKPKNDPILGLYLWGQVGRGKTYLMNLFYDCLPTQRKWRIHFHQFMQDIHHRLGEFSGETDPLPRIAKQLAQQYDLICLDEFFVSDIADAMILANLLDALFAQGLVLVTTSNIHPNNLYYNGLQRQKFLPAIQLILTHLQCSEILTEQDYRLRHLEQIQVFLYPNTTAHNLLLEQYFQKIAQTDIAYKTQIMIDERPVQTLAVAQGVVAINFSELCIKPKGARDYIELAKYFHTILIHDVQPMHQDNEDIAKRFIIMIDEFYDRRVKLMLTSYCELEQLYGQGRLAAEFSRCLSRLVGMQSKDYWQQAHLA